MFSIPFPEASRKPGNPDFLNIILSFFGTGRKVLRAVVVARHIRVSHPVTDKQGISGVFIVKLVVHVTTSDV